MRAEEFRQALRGLGLTGGEFSRLFNVDERTVRRWKSGELDVSRWVPVVLELAALARHWGAAGAFERWLVSRGALRGDVE